MASVHSASTQFSYLTPHTCAHCQRINLCGVEEKLWTQVGPVQSEPWDTPRGNVWYFDRNDDALTFTGICLDDLEESSRAGCDLAEYLSREIGAGFPKELNPHEFRIYTSQDAFYGLFPLKEIFRSGQELVFMGSGGRRVTDLSSEPRTDDSFVLAPVHKLDKCKHGIKYRLTTNRRGFTDQRVKIGKPIVADPLAYDTVKSIRKWRYNCHRKRNTTHKICSLSDPGFLPSRLIHVRDHELRLVSGKFLKDDISYTALSYRWGGDMDTALNEENLQDYRNGIPWSSVPKTIQDAALSTLSLGIDYLWVDSLCIMQDSIDDQHREIGQMTRVYTHATLTIMARRAKNARAGFLHTRSLPQGTSTVAFRFEDGRTGKVALTFESALAKESTELDTRGWVLQEELLSRRLLVIGEWATEWICRKERRQLGNIDGWLKDFGRDTDPFRYWDQWDTFGNKSALRGSEILDAVAFFSAHPRCQLPGPDHDRVLSTWKSLVERYTLRSLSKESDRIVAISGLAEMFSSILEGTEYVAGLWVKDLPESLMWRCNAIEQHQRPSEDKYQGPSWSWTGINGSIKHCDFFGNECSEILSVECVPSHPEAPFGQLKSAKLKVRGPLIELHWTCNLPPFRAHRRLTLIRYLKDSNKYVDAGVVHHWLDTRNSDWTPVTLLAIYPHLENSAGGGIILRENSDGRYSRLGCFKIPQTSYRRPGDGGLPAVEDWMKGELEII